jgi:hypothetical protein
VQPLGQVVQMIFSVIVGIFYLPFNHGDM